MLIEDDTFKLRIVKDDSFKINSTDNLPYDIILNPNNFQSTDYYKAFYISIEKENIKKQIALIGSLFGADECVAILDSNDLIVIMNTSIIVINCYTLTIKKHVLLPENGIYFSIERYCDGYIVYGELDVVKLSKDLEIDWSFAGFDIFITNNGSIPFLIEGENILLTDWMGNKYKLDKFGHNIFN
ncbi:MAG: hypothetical protein FWC47_06480 [Oscillospiraceae bacterium]|nr:hypothetical protein [Oscillospiraceae bacterium]